MLKKNFKNRKYIYAFNSLEIKHESLWFLLNIINSIIHGYCIIQYHGIIVMK